MSGSLVSVAEAESDVVVEAATFEQAIRVWARDYAARYRRAPSPKPNLEDSRAELRRWLTTYCVSAAPGFLVLPVAPSAILLPLPGGAPCAPRVSS